MNLLEPKIMLPRILNLIVEPFEYKLTLQDNILHIKAKHTEDCLVWTTIIDDSLEEPSSIKRDIKTQKQFIINLDPEEVFDLFENYVKKSLDNNVQITFPKMYKTENDHLCIVIDFQMLFGKQRCDTKWIMLNAEPISKDTIIFQKLDNLKTKMMTEIEDITFVVENNRKEVSTMKEEILITIKEHVTKELEKFKITLMEELNNKFEAK